jgi:hypothetical protein
LAEVMLSQPATKIFLRTTEPNAAEWVSRAIGKVEIERMKETHFDGHRSGRNFALDRQIEPLVLDSEIAGLADLHAYLKYGNYVTQFSFPPLEIPPSKPKFIERLEDDYIVREPGKDQPQAAKTEDPPECPPRTESKRISDGHNGQSVLTKPAGQAQEQRQGELSFGPRI